LDDTREKNTGGNSNRNLRFAQGPSQVVPSSSQDGGERVGERRFDRGHTSESTGKLEKVFEPSRNESFQQRNTATTKAATTTTGVVIGQRRGGGGGGAGRDQAEEETRAAVATIEGGDEARDGWDGDADWREGLTAENIDMLYSPSHPTSPSPPKTCEFNEEFILHSNGWKSIQLVCKHCGSTVIQGGDYYFKCASRNYQMYLNKN
jgi:hypothetical protein